MPDGVRPVLLLYCQHSLGVGHLRRSWALAEALSRDFAVVMFNGGAIVPGLDPPDGLDIVSLPPLAQEVGGRLVSLDPGVSVGEALPWREQILLETFHSRRPAVVVIELFPFGRRKFAQELLALLRAARRVPRPLVACSVRDILVGRGPSQQEHDERARAIAEEYFDAVLVHADGNFARLEETFRPQAPMRVPVYYTGFVVPRRNSIADTPDPERRVVISAGGGRYGNALFDAALDAAPALRARLGGALTIVAGPLCPDAVWANLSARVRRMEGVTLHRSVRDLCGLMAASTASVSQCGYNTALDVVQARVPAVVVPFDDGAEDEQMNRARRLERLGLVRVLESAQLSGTTLVSGVEEAVRHRPGAATLDLDGAARSASLLCALLGSHGEAALSGVRVPRDTSEQQ